MKTTLDGATISPFPGLRAYESEDAPFFFGREEHVAQLLQKLIDNRFVAVVGPSGCGKSSLVRAGLVPSLDEGWASSFEKEWKVATFRPGNNPLRRLAEEVLDSGILGDLAVEEDIVEGFCRDLERGPRGLVNRLQANVHASNYKLLIIVDQFEELFRFNQRGGTEESRRFVALLLESVKDPLGAVSVLVTMRSDFIGECPVFYGLPEALNSGQFLTPRLTRDQLRLSIEAPIRCAGGMISPDVVNKILNEVGSDPDQLPLMQHLLMRMWRHASGKESLNLPTPMHKNGEARVLISMKEYEEQGPFVQSIDKHAERVYQKWLETTAEKVAAERLFRLLTDVAADGRLVRRTPAPTLEQIVKRTGCPRETVKSVVEKFRDQGRSFLMPPREVALEDQTPIDITHESVIRQWRRLKEWTEDEANLQQMRRDLTGAARKWQAGGRKNKDAVLQATQWEAAAKVRARIANDMDPVLVEFLDACQRLKLLWGLATILVVALAVVLGTFAYLYHQRRMDTDRLHREMVSRMQHDAARSWEEGDVSASLLWTAEAWNYAENSGVGPSDEQSRLFRLQAGVALASLSQPVAMLSASNGSVTRISPDGKWLAVVNGVADDDPIGPDVKKPTLAMYSYDQLNGGFQLKCERHDIVDQDFEVRLKQTAWSSDSRFFAVSTVRKVKTNGFDVRVWDRNQDFQMVAEIHYENSAGGSELIRPLKMEFVRIPGQSDQHFSSALILLLAMNDDEAGSLHYLDLNNQSWRRFEENSQVRFEDFHVLAGAHAVIGLGSETKGLHIFSVGGEVIKKEPAAEYAPGVLDSIRYVDSDKSSQWLVTAGMHQKTEMLMLWKRNPLPGDIGFSPVVSWNPAQSEINSVAFDPDGRFVVTTSSKDTRAFVWDREAVERSRSFRRYPSFVLQHSQEIDVVKVVRVPVLNDMDSRELIITATRDHVVRVWNAKEGELAVAPIHMLARVEAGGLTCVGDKIAIANSPLKSTITTIWSLPEFQPSSMMIKLPNEANVDVSSGGQYVTAVTKQGEAQVWDRSNPLHSTANKADYLPLAGDGAKTVRLTSDGKWCLVSRPAEMENKLLQLWEKTKEGWKSVGGQPFMPTFEPEIAEISPNGEFVLLVGKGEREETPAEIWRVSGNKSEKLEPVSLNSRQVKEPVSLNSRQVNHVAFSPDSRFAIICGGRLKSSKKKEGEALLVALESEPPTVTHLLHHKYYENADEDDGQAIIHAAFTSNSSLLMTAGEDNAVFVWNPRQPGSEINVLHKHVMDVRCVAVSPDDRWLATSGVDTNVFVWDIRAIGRSLAGFEQPKPEYVVTHDGRANQVVFDPKSRLLACVTEYGTASVWDVPSSVLVARWTQEGSVTSSWFSPDASTLVTTTDLRLQVNSDEETPVKASRRIQLSTFRLPDLKAAEWNTADVLDYAKLVSGRSRPRRDRSDLASRMDGTSDTLSIAPIPQRALVDLWKKRANELMKKERLNRQAVK